MWGNLIITYNCVKEQHNRLESFSTTFSIYRNKTMINVMIVTNVTEGRSREEMSEYLQNIQQIAGKYNFRIIKAVVDHSGGEDPFLMEVFSLIDDMIASAKCDVVILDDTFGYDTTDSYSRLKDLVDGYSISIYHFEDNEIYMPDENVDFDYSTVPFEVFELVFKNEGDEEDDYESFAERIAEARQLFEDRVNSLAPCERHDAKLQYVRVMINAAKVLFSYLEGKVV